MVLNLQLSLLLTWNINGQLNFSADTINRKQAERRRQWQSGWTLQKEPCQYAYLFLTLHKDQSPSWITEYPSSRITVSYSVVQHLFASAVIVFAVMLVSPLKIRSMYVLCNPPTFLKIVEASGTLTANRNLQNCGEFWRVWTAWKNPDEPVLLFSCQTLISPFVSMDLFLLFKIIFLLYKEINLWELLTRRLSPMFQFDFNWKWGMFAIGTEARRSTLQ